MKTYEELFNAALHNFIQDNGQIYTQIQRDAETYAASIGVLPELYIDQKIKEAFIAHIKTNFGNNVPVEIITMMANSELEKEQLLMDFHIKIASSIGVSIDEYLRINKII